MNGGFEKERERESLSARAAPLPPPQPLITDTLGCWMRSGPARRDGMRDAEDEIKKCPNVPKRGRFERACSRPNSITADARGGHI